MMIVRSVLMACLQASWNLMLWEAPDCYGNQRDNEHVNGFRVKRRAKLEDGLPQYQLVVPRSLSFFTHK